MWPNFLRSRDWAEGSQVLLKVCSLRLDIVAKGSLLVGLEPRSKRPAMP